MSMMIAANMFGQLVAMIIGYITEMAFHENGFYKTKIMKMVSLQFTTNEDGTSAWFC